MKQDEEKVIYYTDELHDEFAGDSIVPQKIDGSYRYERTKGWDRLAHIFWYRIVAFPSLKVYLKLYFGHKTVNGKVLKQARKTGYFLYGNHTHFLADALVPTKVAFPKTVSVIVHPNNVSMPYLGRITPYLGALPLPDDVEAGRNFVHVIEYKAMKNQVVMIYPEAHIWPFYTDIRPFTDQSFRYPLQYGKPVFSITNTYQKRTWRKTPRMVTYVDGPFYPDTALRGKEQRKHLRDQVYTTMKARAANNSVTLIRYEKAPEEQGEVQT